MTIPNLIANTNSAKFRSQFKKTLSTLAQAGRMSQAMYYLDYSGINSTCGSDGATHNPEEKMTICAIMNGTLSGVTYYNSVTDLKMSNGKPYSITSNFTTSTITSMSNLSKVHAYLLADGSIFAFSPDLGTHPCSLNVGSSLNDGYSGTSMASCAGFIDVNGVSLPNKEVTCSSGSNSLKLNTCVVKNDPRYMTDIFPVRIHDAIVEPATAAGRYILQTTK